jgi:uncharacterized protein YjiS (DUF1127 family)
MDLLLRLQDELAARWREGLTVDALSQLSDRRLEDTHLSRRDIRRVARIAARSGANGAALADILAQLDAGEPERDEKRGPVAAVRHWLQSVGDFFAGPSAARARNI